MDDKAYTCFYCHSILPYEVCISGTHFCLQATNAIEFWGNVVKIASTNSVDEQETDATNERTFKVEEEEPQMEDTTEEGMEEESEEVAMYSEMDTETSGTEPKVSEKSGDDSVLDTHEKSDMKPMSWKLKMIALVKQRPPLYDKRLPLSERTFPIRAKLWKEVFEGLNGLVPIELLPKRFKVLRDRYNKEVKRIRLGHQSRKQWSLYKYLAFLSSAKKKICVKKMGLLNGDSRMDDASDKTSLDNGEKSSSLDKTLEDELYKENLEIKKKFVELVGERPPLYDCRLPRPVRIAENKVKLWREVYEALDGAIPLVDLPRKFKSLRDRYMKEKKKQANNEPSANWPLMEYMTYLDDVAYIRSQESSHLEETIAMSAEKRKNLDDKKADSGIDAKVSSPSLTNVSDGVPSPADDSIAQDDIDTNKEEVERSEKDCQLNEVTKYSNQSSSTASKNSNRSKQQLDVLEAFDTWTEDDFFGAYLVRLMRRIPIEDKLRLHVQVINMIKNCLKSQ